ncbi:hypothetical protein GGX14DRAFT_397757 [Mycena pura]|uniref:Uncharacterized protein n=1 Tax=Mycena pura TaxID=153505 RepID=A0AAD6V7Q2_9AGAR|nr:hypothetical protein GGX14DRAFT_397757 [Mycena pura]
MPVCAGEFPLACQKVNSPGGGHRVDRSYYRRGGNAYQVMISEQGEGGTGAKRWYSAAGDATARRVGGGIVQMPVERQFESSRLLTIEGRYVNNSAPTAALGPSHPWACPPTPWEKEGHSFPSRLQDACRPGIQADLSQCRGKPDLTSAWRWGESRGVECGNRGPPGAPGRWKSANWTSGRRRADVPADQARWTSGRRRADVRADQARWTARPRASWGAGAYGYRRRRCESARSWGAGVNWVHATKRVQCRWVTGGVRVVRSGRGEPGGLRSRRGKRSLRTARGFENAGPSTSMESGTGCMGGARVFARVGAKTTVCPARPLAARECTMLEGCMRRMTGGRRGRALGGVNVTSPERVAPSAGKQTRRVDATARRCRGARDGPGGAVSGGMPGSVVRREGTAVDEPSCSAEWMAGYLGKNDPERKFVAYKVAAWAGGGGGGESD